MLWIFRFTINSDKNDKGDTVTLCEPYRRNSEGFCLADKSKQNPWNSIRPISVVPALLEMSTSASGIWWCERTRPTWLKSVLLPIQPWGYCARWSTCQEQFVEWASDTLRRPTFVRNFTLHEIKMITMLAYFWNASMGMLDCKIKITRVLNFARNNMVYKWKQTESYAGLHKSSRRQTGVPRITWRLCARMGASEAEDLIEVRWQPSGCKKGDPSWRVYMMQWRVGWRQRNSA